ncbi:hypothetical protein Zmor_001409 [Zophobas morio]|uniref:Uncharacterized protein n=1 Tax=Zophobas morio TaxID=2755281 RepID=A0AA38MRX0_9CUCU|nr:hypothetical protein Zmor_001409 [Zophobas morio]
MDINEAAIIASQSLLLNKSRTGHEFPYGGGPHQPKLSGSLWCQYSMLKTRLNYKDNVNISKFSKLVEFLKWKHQCYQPEKSSINKREILKFIEHAADETYLLIKTVMIVGIARAYRTDDFCKMEMADVTDHT